MHILCYYSTNIDEYRFTNNKYIARAHKMFVLIASNEVYM